MKPHAKTALPLALAIVGGMAAGMRCDASEWMENSAQINLRPAAYTVKAYTGHDPYVDSYFILLGWKLVAADICKLPGGNR